MDEHKSASYLRRKKNTLIIGSDVLKISDRHFYAAMGTTRRSS